MCSISAEAADIATSPSETEAASQESQDSSNQTMLPADPESFDVGEPDDITIEEDVPPESTPIPSPKKSAKTPKSPATPEKAPAVQEDTTTPESLLQELETAREKHFTDLALLQGINKITARTYAFKVPIGTKISFGNLDVFVERCWKSAPDEAPDSKVLLQIWEQKPGEAKTSLFHGWMFASSPALSALEHPVYDVTLQSCTQSNDRTVPVQAPPSSPAKATP